MNQNDFNRNIINAISLINKAVLSLQVKVIAISMLDTHTAGIAELTRMDRQILEDLQDNINLIKSMLEQ